MSKITVMIFENVEDELCEKIKAVVRSASQTEEIEFSTDDDRIDWNPPYML